MPLALLALLKPILELVLPLVVPQLLAWLQAKMDASKEETIKRMNEAAMTPQTRETVSANLRRGTF